MLLFVAVLIPGLMPMPMPVSMPVPVLVSVPWPGPIVRFSLIDSQTASERICYILGW